MAATVTATAATMASRTRSAKKVRRPDWATGLRIENEGCPAQLNDEVVSVTSVTGRGARAPDANATPQTDAPAGAGAEPSERMVHVTSTQAASEDAEWYAHARRGSTRIPATQVNVRTATAMARLKPTNMQLYNAQDMRTLGPNSNDKPDWCSATQHMWTSWR